MLETSSAAAEAVHANSGTARQMERTAIITCELQTTAISRGLLFTYC